MPRETIPPREVAEHSQELAESYKALVRSVTGSELDDLRKTNSTYRDALIRADQTFSIHPFQSVLLMGLGVGFTNCIRDSLSKPPNVGAAVAWGAFTVFALILLIIYWVRVGSGRTEIKQALSQEATMQQGRHSDS